MNNVTEYECPHCKHVHQDIDLYYTNDEHDFINRLGYDEIEECCKCGLEFRLMYYEYMLTTCKV